MGKWVKKFNRLMGFEWRVKVLGYIIVGFLCKDRF